MKSVDFCTDAALVYRDGRSMRGEARFACILSGVSSLCTTTVPVSAGQSGYRLRQTLSLSSKSHPHMTIPPQVLSYSRGDSADPFSQISTPPFSLRTVVRVRENRCEAVS